jgi:CheY-like chemotaxis protein
VNDGLILAALKALSNETKALVIVSELEARRMPSFQLRTIFNGMLKDDDERRIILDLIDKDLQASGYPEDQVSAMLGDLLTVPNALQLNESVQSTRRLRSPFAQNFEGQMATPAGFNAAGQGSPQYPGYTGAPDSTRSASVYARQSPPNGLPAIPVPEGAGAPAYSPYRTGSYPAAGAAGIPRGGPSLNGPGLPATPRTPLPDPRVSSMGATGVVPAAQRYAQNAFHNPEEIAPPPKPSGFSRNSYQVASESTTPPPQPQVPGMPANPPSGTSQRASQIPLGPGLREAGGVTNTQRFGRSAAMAASVAEAALLTPGLANVNGQLSAKVVSRTEGSPNNFKSGQATQKPNDGRPVVLIADDDKRIRMVFRLRMEESGLTVIECADGTEAWDRIQQGDISLAVLDMKMPGLHGLEVLSRMADKQFRIPVIVCSAYDQLKDEFIVQTYPRLRYLVKPVAPEQLVGSIKELLVKA